jgi:ribonuclease HII
MFLGIDEAGRGPVLGPLVVAGLTALEQVDLIEMGVRDSKLLTREKRERIFEILTKEHYHGILTVPATSIDKARDEMTMNELEVACFASIITSMHRGEPVIHPLLPDGVKFILEGPFVEFDRVLMDAADVNEERFGDDVLEETHRLENIGGIGFLSKHKADLEFPVVGAASILAKVHRDLEIESLSNEIGKDIGSGYPSDPNTISFLKEYIEENGDIPHFARRSWETSRKLLSARNQSKLADF